jgi:hypothetical protein
MMIKKWYLRMLLLTTLCIFIHLSASAQRTRSKYPVAQFKDITDVASDTFRISVVVVDIFRCPPCPEGAQCKPCIGDHIAVEEGKTGKETLRIFAHDPDQFVKGKRYILTVRSRSSVKTLRKEFLEFVIVN